MNIDRFSKWGEINEKLTYPRPNRIPEKLPIVVPKNDVIIRPKKKSAEINNSYCQNIINKANRKNSSIINRPTVDLSKKNIETDIRNAIHTLLLYYGFDQAEEASISVLEELFYLYIQNFGKVAGNLRCQAHLKKKQDANDLADVINKTIGQTGIVQDKTNSLFELCNWYRHEYIDSNMKTMISCSTKNTNPRGSLVPSILLTSSKDENEEYLDRKQNDTIDPIRSRKSAEFASSGDNYDEFAVQDMVANPLVGDLDTLVATQSINSFSTNHKRKQLDVLLPQFDETDQEKDIFGLFFTQ